MKSCFFIGHRDISHTIFPQLCEEVERHIVAFGVTEFVVGNYGGFDHMAASAVIAAQKRHPEITLSMLIPYHPAERPIEAPPGFDNTFYPPGMEKVPRKLAIVRANRYMIDHADYLIAYVCTRQAMHGIFWNTRRNGKEKLTVGNPFVKPQHSGRWVCRSVRTGR